MSKVAPVHLRALDRATSYVGVRETPPGSNRGRLIDQWNRNARVPLGSSYCDSFHYSMFSALGVMLGGGAYCPTTFAWMQKQGWEKRRPLRGYSVFYDWNQDGILDHVGFIERVLAVRWKNGRFVGWVRTIEANTSSGVKGSQSDGDGVYRRWRWVNSSTRFACVEG